ncbi:DNA-binding FadR family transcriptional regulator [Clostridium acetobutylicum]|uniref:Transcriptional regulator, FadR family n=1 Tax=Clostridium acetobutylicum (strain ATCC 824 / DSM 792 / JCM 1419 / IAM 19013 / LMG 5710 / NBRC 13948 / NRRL B-527 / VKM B-1787 / 2291 / W) TaxID=272562 RepID=Q97D77_CLOAB|nr:MULTISPECIES: FadR/GntR family transcriptional regulator [Clostridium]AAK81526.1 Transcriptional regulator, FadR family [Clostridium acetobutylicum ATCC 824]ADZ22647.1 Transcriptional regulator, FadR family [Clostridium acetobutylicum EA 2018]AEI33805.1 FadR family transcriptional regulator [Clostridium acetobutylicum DSM 1731]AWV80801.1 FadR family transcriptional regulator [Clostridium acetobutylicum]MBC2393874.1 FadR family transcriptional regulator [Clostridium acetobutylicum]
MEDGRTSDKVLEKIQEKIFSGEWKPGQKIMSETKLAEDLNVSRVSVREAIEKLAAFNIVSKKKGGGTFINDLGPSVYLNSLLPMLILNRDNYLEILEFRLITEPESAKLCAERCDDELIISLEKIYDNMKNYKDDIQKFTKEDLNFHTKIAEGTKNSLIIKINELLMNILEYHQRGLYETLGPKGGICEHKFILDAIKNRDSELAFIYSRRHAERTINDLKKLQT